VTRRGQVSRGEIKKKPQEKQGEKECDLQEWEEGLGEMISIYVRRKSE